MTFRTRLFVTSVGAIALALGVSTALVSSNLRRTMAAGIERALVDQTRLAAETLSHRAASTSDDLDREADKLGELISARVTFIAADGRVVGDSSVPRDELAALENHGDRPEVARAHADGIGIARRYSSTINVDLLYVAVRLANPRVPDIAVVRLARPLTEIDEQLAVVRRAALVAFAIGFAIAFAVAWLTSVFVSRRVRRIAAAAEHYDDGDFSQPIRDDGADEIGTVARVLDQTVQELGRRVQELGADRARIAAILGGMVEGVLVVDDHGRVQLVNDAARRMLKLQGAVDGRHYLEVLRHPDVAVQLGAALQGATPDRCELTLPRDPGVTLVARAAPVASAAARGAVLVLHDVSDLKRADQIRRDFVANVSHELRTPLTAIRGYVEALLDEEPDDGASKPFLETIARHAARMERLVRDLLRLARLDARQEPLDRSLCAVETLFAGAAGDLDAEIEARRLTIDIRVTHDAAAVDVDPAKMHDVLRNLIENAVKHAPEGSRIVLESARRGESVLMSVADEGPGIPEADLSRVFERFYRVDKARSRDGRDPGGTGLGLAIVKHLVELHGGIVWAANRPERGALFVVELPLSGPTSASA